MGQLCLITSFSFPPSLTPLSFAFALIELVSLCFCLRGFSSQVAELLLRSLAGSYPVLWDFMVLLPSHWIPCQLVGELEQVWESPCDGGAPSLAPAEDQGALPSSGLKQNLVIPAPAALARFPRPPPLSPVRSSSKHDDVWTTETQQTECQVAGISVRGSECSSFLIYSTPTRCHLAVTVADPNFHWKEPWKNNIESS